MNEEMEDDPHVDVEFS